MKKYTIKNNIVLFQKSFLSQWYGAYKGQENGQFEMLFKIIDEKGILRNKTIKFNCAEQAMMYFKARFFEDSETAELILKETDPAKQKALGRSVKNYDETRWNKKRYNVVLDINRDKFRQNEDIRKILCDELNDYIIAEAAPWDKIWGIGLGPNDPKAWDVATWEGQNLLGKVLMQVRDELLRDEFFFTQTTRY